MNHPKLKLLLQFLYSPPNTKSNILGQELLDASAILAWRTVVVVIDPYAPVVQ